jgi:putative flippase GtrA
VLVYVMVDSGRLFPDNWLYINDPSVQLGRVTNFANWSADMLPNHEQTPLCCEYWCQFEGLWKMDDDALVAMAERDLRKIGLLNDEAVNGGFVIRLPRTYPIYAGNYKEALATIQNHLQGINNLQAVGRYGAFKYNNQDHSLLMGIMAAENVTTPGKHDLWTVNSDDDYQEEAKESEVTTPVSKQSPAKKPVLPRLVNQLGTYLLTGGIATIVDVMVFSGLTKAGLWYVFALCISYFFGLTTNFWLSQRYVFGIYWQNWRLQYVVFATVALNSLLANLGLLQLLINELGWDATLARLVSAGSVAMLSFAGHKLYSFKGEYEAQSERSTG